MPVTKMTVLRFAPVFGRDPYDSLTTTCPGQGDSLDVRVNGIDVAPGIRWIGSGTAAATGSLETKHSTALPDRFAHEQDCPNPFNAQTQITFSQPKASVVRLELYSILGQRVATLLDGSLDPGVHVVTWDGSACASGVYFCRLRAGDRTATRRMPLLK